MALIVRYTPISEMLKGKENAYLRIDELGYQKSHPILANRKCWLSMCSENVLFVYF